MSELTKETISTLKLKIGEKGQIRRIPFSKLWDETSATVSYQKLIHLALGFFHESSSISTSNEEYIDVTYVDEDGDYIALSSDDELTDAFSQFVNRDPPVLRATVSINDMVVIDKIDKNIRGRAPVVDSLDSTPKTAPEPEKKNHQGLFSKGLNKKLCDSITTTITHATDSISKAVKVNKKCPHSVTVSTFQTEKSEDGKRKIVFSSMATGSCAKVINVQVKSCSNTKSSSEQEKSEDDTKEKSNIKKPDYDFVHGRHTCDGCLVTPIIGLRYHSNSLKDYDLCSNCVKQSTKEDNKFLQMKSERDVQMQDKWKRRQAARLKKGQDKWKKCQDIKKERKPCELEMNDDNRMKEGIRRSLQDEQEKKRDIETSPSNGDDINKTPVDVPTISAKRVLSTSLESISTKSDDVMNENFILSENRPEQEKKNVACQDSSFLEDAEGEGEIANMIGNTLDSFTKAIDAIVSEAKKPELTECATSVMDTEVDDVFTVSEAKKPEHAECAVSVTDTEISEIITEVIDVIVSETKKPEHTGFTTSDTDTEIDEVIMKDNNNCCEETILESEGISSKESDEDWQVLSTSEQVSHDEMVAQAAQLLGSAMFESDILSNEDNKLDQDHESKSRGSISEKTKGSKSNHDSLYSDESSLSTMSTFKSPISSVVLSRWDDELRKLHEIGFYDDYRSIDALEHLEAANIGVDSQDGVSLSKVVDYLLS